MYGSAWNARRLGMRTYRKGKAIGELRSDVWQQLKVFQRSYLEAYPAAANLDDGTYHDCVLFFEEGSRAQEHWIPKVGFMKTFYVHDYSQKRVIEPESVSFVSQSPRRTPLDVEKEMWSMHSYSMGSEGLVIIHMSNGTRMLAGPYYEFLTLPQGYTTKDIVQVSEFSPEEGFSAQLPEVMPMLCMFRRPRDSKR